MLVPLVWASCAAALVGAGVELPPARNPELAASEVEAPPQGARRETQSGSSVIAPSVIASSLITRDEGGEGTLELLVLWRGSPGWFLRRSGSGGSMSGGGPLRRSGIVEWSIREGGLHLTASFDPARRVATVLGDLVALDDANVILVDDVDSPAGPRVVKALAVAPALGKSPGVHPVLIGSPELLDFLRCHAQTPDRQSLNYICAEAIFRELVSGERTVTPIPVGPVQNRAADATPLPSFQPDARSGSSSGSAVVSPTVVAGWFTRRDGPAAMLDLLVLWRGSPAWALRGNQAGGSSGGGAGQRQGMTIRRGDLALHAVYDAAARTCEIEGRVVPLGDDNVVLVDDVDSRDGPRVVKTLRIDRALVTTDGVAAAIRRSPELAAFLQCDVKLPDARQQAVMNVICMRFAGK
jgi:hypothetical protein